MLGLHCAEEKISKDNKNHSNNNNNNNSLNSHGMKEVLQILRDSKESCYSAVLTLNDMVTSDKIRSGQLILNKKYVNVIQLISEHLRDFYPKVYKYILYDIVLD